MADLVKCKRILFPKGKQSVFIARAVNRIGLTTEETARLLSVSAKTISDWKREKFLLPLEAAKILSGRSHISLPRGIKIKNPYWHVKKAAKLGGIRLYQKYGIVGGNPEKRKILWRKWWKNEGQYKKHPIINKPLSFKKPKIDENFAEFFGIMIGDGGISRRQICITLNHKDDAEYIKWVAKLIKKLFGISPSIYHKPEYSVKNLVVSRSKLVEYLHSLGLPIGDKIRNKIDVPDWIKNNDKFKVACVRGLIDTDGSVFTHNYKIKNKWYSYKKLDFTSASSNLIRSVYKILKQFKFNPRISGRNLRLDSIKDVKKYFEIIGSSNPKHLKRYKN